MKNIALLLAALLLMSGCGKGNEAINEAIKGTVRRYNTLLAEGYRHLSMNPLVQVATKERAAKAYHHMAALGVAKARMYAVLQSINFSDIKLISRDRAEAITQEAWDYTYVNIDSGEPDHDNSVTYKLKYSLVKISNKWFVADITVEEAKETKKSEYPRFFQRPPGEVPGRSLMNGVKRK